MSYSNYNQGTYGSGVPIVNPTQYTNPGTLLHNNMPKNIRQVNVAEYTITIDSAHRDLAKYPNPYEYNVSFNPQSIYKVERPSIGFDGMIILDSDNNPIMETVSQEVAGPIIREALQKAQFIKVERAVLPKLGLLSALNTVDKLDGDRYTILQIPEFQDECKPCRFGTSQQLSLAAAILTPVHATLTAWQVYETQSPAIAFRAPRDVRSLTVRLLDSQGKPLTIPGVETCNICKYHIDRHANPWPTNQTSVDSSKPIGSFAGGAGGGGFILDAGKVQQTQALAGSLSVRNVGNAILITGTVNALVVDLRIDPHRIVAGTILGQKLNEPVVWSNWSDSTFSGSIDTKTMSYHGSLRGTIIGVLRVGIGGVDWWCYINSTTGAATALGWTNLYWSDMERSTNTTDPSQFNMRIANLITLAGNLSGGSYRIGTVSVPVQQAIADNLRIGNVKETTGALALALGTTISLNSSIGTDNVTASGTAGALVVNGTAFGSNVSGTYTANYTADRTWVQSTAVSKIPALSMATIPSEHRNYLRLQGWIGGNLFFSASIRPDMTLSAAIIFQGIPGTVRAEIYNGRMIGTFELSDGRTGTLNSSFVAGTVVVNDGTILTWNGSTVTSSFGTVWNVAFLKGGNWASVSGDLGTGVGYWDETTCSCKVHPADPRIQHCLLLTVGVHEETMNNNHRIYQV
jgi:hypothetical protein